MAPTTPVAFPNVAAIETMMAGLGSAKCKSLGIGRQDNYNAKIHRPREGHQNPQTKAIVGRIYQHRVFSVNKPNGRIVWIFERASDDMLFLLKPRKGPLAYKVWQADQTFSTNLWLYGQNWVDAEKAAELRGPADLQQWLQTHRPLDAGTSGDYVEYKAHVAKLATTLPVPQSLAATLNNDVDLPDAPPSPDAHVTEPIAEPGSAEETAPAVAQPEPQPGQAAATTSTVAAKKTKSRTKAPAAAVPPSGRVLRTRSAKKRNADEAELDEDKPAQQQEQEPELEQAPPVDMAGLVELQKPATSRPEPDPASLQKVKRAPKKRKYRAEGLRVEEAHCEQHSMRLLSSWSSIPGETVDRRELVGVDVVPFIQKPALEPEFSTSQQRTIIRYGKEVTEAFGGFTRMGGRVVAQIVPVSGRRSATSNSSTSTSQGSW